MNRIGILGGTFNPIHCGHIMLASEIQKRENFDEILVIPTQVPPHKTSPFLASFEDRATMCRIATAQYPFMKVSEIEKNRIDKCYSYYTVEEILREEKCAEITFVMGSDMFLSFHTWHRYKELLEMMRIATSARTPGDREKLIAYKEEMLGGADVKIYDLPIIEISSTRLRDMIASGEDTSRYIPTEVKKYIDEKGIYNA